MLCEECVKRLSKKWLPVYEDLLTVISNVLKKITDRSPNCPGPYIAYHSTSAKLLHFKIITPQNKNQKMQAPVISLTLFLVPTVTEITIEKTKRQIDFDIKIKKSTLTRAGKKPYVCEFEFTPTNKEEKLRKVLAAFSKFL